jgi:hypothetical protein
MSNPHAGSNFDDFLKQENIYEEVTQRAEKRVADIQMKLEAAIGVTNEGDPAKPKYTLDDLLARCDENPPIPAVIAELDSMAPVSKEII